VIGGGLRSRDRFAARSLDALCDPQHDVAAAGGTTRYRAATLGHLPSATQSQSYYQWNRFEHPVHGGRGYSAASGGSPLVIEMAREIEHLKSQLAVFQRNAAEQSGLGKNGNSVPAESDLVDRDHRTPSPLKTDDGGSPSIQRAASLSPSRGKLDLQGDEGNFAGGGGRRWSGDGGLAPDHQEPLVVELRAQVARLQDQLRSIPQRSEDASADAVDYSRRLTEKNSTSAESITVAHLRGVIQVGTIITNSTIIATVIFIHRSFLSQLSLAIHLWIGATSASESWDVNRHTARCTS